MEKKLFDVLTEYATGERFDTAVQHDSGYKENQENVNIMIAQMEAYCHTEEEKQVVEECSEAFALLELCYCRLAYRQGFKDCVSLLSEIGLIK